MFSEPALRPTMPGSWRWSWTCRRSATRARTGKCKGCRWRRRRRRRRRRCWSRRRGRCRRRRRWRRNNIFPMMQRDARAADFLDQCFATRLKFLQIRRAKRLVGRSGKNQIRYFQIAHRPVIRSGQCVNLFRDPKRCFPNPVVWPDVAHDCRIHCIGENDQRIISDFRSVVPVRKCPRHDDVGIGRSDQKAGFFQRRDFIAQLHQCEA